MLNWILLMIAGISFFAIMAIWVLPHLFLKNRYSLDKPKDRGLKKYKFSDEDYAVVYEPSPEARRFIKQYVLAKRDGKKTVKCKLAEGVAYINFDVVLFDSNNKAFLVMNSSDVVGEDGMTAEMEIPPETSYATVLINQANDTVLRQEKSVNVGFWHLFGFTVCNVAISMVSSMCLLYSISNLFGGIFRESFPEKMITSGLAFIIPAAVSLVITVIASFILNAKNKKR